MTIVAAHGIGVGDRITSIIMVADSRITRTSPISGRYVSRTDTGQKLIRIAPNIIMGIAGDYRAVELIVKISKKLQKTPVSSPLFTNRSDVVMSIISRGLRDEWSYDDTSFLFGIEDLQDRNHKIYIIEYPGFVSKRLGIGLHVIGSDRNTQETFKDAVRKQTEYIQPKSLQEHSIPLWSAMGEVYGQEIAGSSGCFLLTDGQCIALNHAVSPDGGGHWIANAFDENGTIRRQINGKTVEETSHDYSKIDCALSKPPERG